MTSVTLSPTPLAADRLLHPYVSGDERAAEERLETLVRDEALPIVRGVVGVRMGRDGRDLDDICNDIVLQVLRRLRTARELGDGEPIASFRAYVATAAYRGCDAWLREKYPERHRLRNRVQYLVSHHPDFFLRAGEKRRWLCGLARDIYAADRTLRLREMEMQGIDWLTEGSPKGERLAALCYELLENVRGAVDLEVLVSSLARGLDPPRGTTSERNVADDRAHAAVTLELQSHLRRLWSELRLLPRGPRVAVLLNLRGADGEHLEYDTIEGWVDGAFSPSERRTASAHLHSCPQCQADLADLYATARSIPGLTVAHGNMSLKIAAILVAILGVLWLALR